MRSVKSCAFCVLETSRESRNALSAWAWRFVFGHQLNFALKSEQFGLIESLARVDREIQSFFQSRHRFGKLASLRACFGQQSEEVWLELTTTDRSNTSDDLKYLFKSVFRLALVRFSQSFESGGPCKKKPEVLFTGNFDSSSGMVSSCDAITQHLPEAGGEDQCQRVGNGWASFRANSIELLLC